jgi:two-component system response regulator BaeR
MNMPKHTVMLVEDDERIADMLLNYLTASGFDTLHFDNGLHALHHLQQHPRPPDLLLLDLMLPGMDGVALCKAVRQFSMLPILMVTARVDEVDRLLGFEIGADDYICKPFSPREVVARVRSHLRRVVVVESPAWQVSALHQQVFWHGKPLPLTPVEFRLLQLLASRPGHVFGRARLLEQLHEDQRDISDRAVDSHIKNIRRKLAQAEAHELHITSVYGVGYRFETTA